MIEALENNEDEDNSGQLNKLMKMRMAVMDGKKDVVMDLDCESQ